MYQNAYFRRPSGSRFQSRTRYSSRTQPGAYRGDAPSERSPYSRFNSRPHKSGQRSFGSGRGRRFSSSIPAERYIKKAAFDHQEETQVGTSITFADMALHEKIKKNLQGRKFVSPTKIQEKSIPHILAGKDVVGIANTGTGKTGAFVIPLLERIYTKQTAKVLIIVPTRELAQQIQDEIRDFSYDMRIYSALCIGGGSMHYQMRQLRQRPEFVVGTPGRLKDFVQQGVLTMTQFDTVVLDEVDRMVDMGFIKDITHLLSLIPETRQSLFFSATITPEVEKTIQTFSHEPVTVTISTQKASDNVDQDVIRVQGTAGKTDILSKLLEKEEFKKVLIFGRTKHGVERLTETLYKKNFKVASIHGDKPQRKREQAIRLFQDDVVTILIATDVAARGLDIDDITHVINYDEPATYDDYIHRIGRTGRAGKKGFALTFVTG